MRTETERKVIPPDLEPVIIETTRYVCDEPGCIFETEDEDEANGHAAKHACKRVLEVDGNQIRWFDTEDGAKTWLDQEYSNHVLGFRVRQVDWIDPGWYLEETWDQPCRRGCCRDMCVKLFPVEVYLSEKTSEARSIMRKVTEIKQAIKNEQRRSEETGR